MHLELLSLVWMLTHSAFLCVLLMNNEIGQSILRTYTALRTSFARAKFTCRKIVWLLYISYHLTWKFKMFGYNVKFVCGLMAMPEFCLVLDLVWLFSLPSESVQICKHRAFQFIVTSRQCLASHVAVCHCVITICNVNLWTELRIIMWHKHRLVGYFYSLS